MRRAADTCGESVPPAVPDTRSGVRPGRAMRPDRSGPRAHPPACPGRDRSPTPEAPVRQSPRTGPRDTENAMTSTTTLRRIARLSIGALVAAACSPGWRHRRSRPPRRPPGLASARHLPYGPDTCKQGFVWREAALGDHVCVTPATRQRTWNDNARAAARRDPNGPYPFRYRPGTGDMSLRQLQTKRLTRLRRFNYKS